MRVILAGSVCAVHGARLHISKARSFQHEGAASDLQVFFESIGVNRTTALRIERVVDAHFPPTLYKDDDRRMTASRLLQMELLADEFHEDPYLETSLQEHEADAAKAQDLQDANLEFPDDLAYSFPGDRGKAPPEGFLGPLKKTRCKGAKALATSSGLPQDGQALKTSVGSLQECAKGCGSQCKVFSFKDGQCQHFAKCVPEKSDQHEVFVKNEAGITPHNLPTRKLLSKRSGHIFVIGDWGGFSSPKRASMHYKWTHVQKGSAEWKRDDEAQGNVAKQMAAVGQKAKPFMVLNAGDNFYWGGIEMHQIGGRGIYHKYWDYAYEKVYSDASLKVPWLGIMGNHDYGGEGCFADVRAQFDYTVKDMLLNNRWVIPSPYYNHVVQFDGFSAEFFMVDSNIDNAEGSWNNICEQSKCPQGKTIVKESECRSWFAKLWKEQGAWYDKVLAASKADWKVVMMHHKPEGRIAQRFIPAIKKHGVQLMIGSHTHELAFFDPWEDSGIPLVVVGAGGGAQSNPHSGKTKVYRSPRHEYGFADLEINKQQITVRLHNDKGKEVMSRNVCSDGKVKSTCR